MSNSETPRNHFIRQIIEADISSGKLPNANALKTRFPPEPNGYLHIGHAKSICLNFGLARDYGGQCNLRFDDTNPTKEEVEYVESIKQDVAWLGFEPAGMYFASDYFTALHAAAVQLIQQDLAYVDDLSADEIRVYRGTLTEAGKDSPFRTRSIAENLDLFTRMKAGEFTDGSKLLRAKIDMAAGNINLRDPALYRIRHATHHQTGDQWCIYPMYDFAHALSDALEGITHSICTLEFEDHRPLYDWLVAHVDLSAITVVHNVCGQPRQFEFSRLTLQYTITSKRKLTTLVTEQHVDGWDDPRMPTIAGLRRRGVPAAALHLFCERIGVTKADNSVEMSLLESSIRDTLDPIAPRAMAVLNPIKLTLSNYPDHQVEQLSLANHPKNAELGQRLVPFSREIWIDRADFLPEADKKYKRLVLNDYVRLRGAYIVRCTDMVCDAQGQLQELIGEIVPDSVGTNIEGIKARGVIHWVSVGQAIDATVHLYDRLFNVAHPEREEGEFVTYLNPHSLLTQMAKLEPSLSTAPIGVAYQFEREAYFARDSHADTIQFNRVVTLKDNWNKP